MKRKAAGDADTNQTIEWEEIVCPICMEHPHNAVILRCSSYKKGCRSYICDTSYMHSNCLDRFVEQSGGPKSWHSIPSSSNTDEFPGLDLDVMDGIEPYSAGSWNRSGNGFVRSSLPAEQSVEPEHTEVPWGRIASQIHNSGFSCQPDMSIICPMCRGLVTGWEMAVDGRKHLNLMKRSCTHDGCLFSGNYRELRQHARNDHFGTNPINHDPTREQSWRRLEQQRERDDIISALHSATPNAVVLGDYVIERGERQLDEEVDAMDQQWLDALYILNLHMINSAHPESSRRSRPWSRHRRFPGASSQRIRLPGGTSDHSRLLWGENLLGMQNDEDTTEHQDNLNVSNEPDGDQPPAPRR